MKKNRLFVLGLVTVFVALVSLTFVSSTWAKYTTTQSGSDSARVAYWGFNGTTNLSVDLFDEGYNDTVQSENGDKVIAPGTSGSTTVGLQYSEKAGVASAPEVDYKVTYTLSEDDFTAGLETHPNILFKVSIGGVEKCAWSTWENLVKSYVVNYEAGSNAQQITVEWKWVFDANIYDDGDGNGDYTDKDVFDTELGNAGEATAEVIITINAEQVD